MSHVLDTHAGRFGWRVWHLNQAESRLQSPIHRGQVRFGRRIVESICEHRSEPLTLSPDCNCGIYFEDLARSDQRWRFDADLVGAENVALTFGAAVGEVGADPILPESAMRAPRYAILAVLIPRSSSAVAAELRRRYDTNVFLRNVTPDAMRQVEDAVRGDLRTADADRFFEQLQAEEAHSGSSEHIMDRSPNHFGWRVWRLHTAERRLSDPEDEHPIACHRKPDGSVYFEATAGPGLSYVTSGLYCAHRIDQLTRRYTDAGHNVELAATFGIADVAVTKEAAADLDTHRSRRHFPMAMCIPSGRANLAPTMQDDYGMLVASAMTPRMFREIEQMARRKLDRC